MNQSSSEHSQPGRLIMPAKQTRSREQAERIIAAGLELLTVSDFEALNVEQISDKAGCCPATLYRRFADKDALLTVLAERISRQIVTEMSEALVDGHDDAESLQDVVTRLVAYHVRLYRKYDALMRAMLIRRLKRQESSTPMHDAGKEIVARALETAKKFKPKHVPADVFARRFRVAMDMVNGSLIRSIIFQQDPSYLNDDSIIREMSRVMTASLVDPCRSDQG